MLEDRVLNVRSSLVQVGPKWVEGKPKTASGERRVDLGERTVGLLLMVQLAQGEDRKRWGAAYQDYADLRIMPTLSWMWLGDKGIVLRRSA